MPQVGLRLVVRAEQGSGSTRFFSDIIDLVTWRGLGTTHGGEFVVFDEC